MPIVYVRSHFIIIIIICHTCMSQLRHFSMYCRFLQTQIARKMINFAGNEDDTAQFRIEITNLNIKYYGQIHKSI